MAKRPKPKNAKLIRWLTSIEACKPAIRWAYQFRTFDEAWQDLSNFNWMLWLTHYVAGGSWKQLCKTPIFLFKRELGIRVKAAYQAFNG